MANCCFLEMDCIFDSGEWASKYGGLMTEMWDYARSAGHMSYMGDSRKYLGDADVQTTDDGVGITGWTKWALPEDSALNVIAFAKFVTNNHLVSMTIDYHEPGFQVHGRYTYTRGVTAPDGTHDERSGKVVDRYIPEKEWPDTKTDGDGRETFRKGGRTWDSEEDALSEILAESGVEKVIHDCL